MKVETKIQFKLNPEEQKIVLLARQLLDKARSEFKFVEKHEEERQAEACIKLLDRIGEGEYL